MQSIDIIKQKLIKEREKKRRVKTIFKKFSKYKTFEYWSGITLINAIVYGLTELGLPYSKDEINTAFELIPLDEFEEDQKGQIKKELKKSAINKSPFN